MFIVMESCMLPIIGINVGGSDNSSFEVTADVFYASVHVAEAGFGVDIETIKPCKPISWWIDASLPQRFFTDFAVNAKSWAELLRTVILVAILSATQ